MPSVPLSGTGREDGRETAPAEAPDTSMTNQTVAYQCPCCGAGLGFDPEKQKFACEFCLSEFDEAELEAAGAGDAAKRQFQADTDYCEHMNLYTCPNCGAEMAADEDTAADLCYYCHNPVVLAGRLTGQMSPHKVVPFRIHKEEAEKLFKKWCRYKWFLPKSFTSSEHAAQIRGVYYPFWVTDADAVGTLQANATRTHSWRVGDYRYTETSRYDIHRAGDIHFEDIVTCALSDADKKMLEGVLPYPSAELTDFSMPYLSGFLAKKRDIERASLTEEVRARMQEYTRTLLSGTITAPYATMSVRNTGVHIKSSHWEYALLPIWILTWTDKRGKVFTFAINGSTGKIYGELPISYGKLAILGAAVALPVAVILTLLGGAMF